MGRALDAVTFGPRRRARRMTKQLRRLDRHDELLRAAGIDPLDEWLRVRDPRPMARATSPVHGPVYRRRPVATALIVTLAIGTVAVLQYRKSDSAFVAGQPSRPASMPPEGVEERGVRLGVPAPAPPGRGGYSFLAVQSDGNTPVGWDPCRPIHFVTSGTAPVGEARVVASALTEVTRLTGFRFIDDGPTSEQAVPNRAAYQPDRYGRRWAPVLVAWTSPDQVPALAGNTIGLGGGEALRWASTSRTYVSGIVYLDAQQFRAELRHRQHHRQVQAELRAVVLHEVGHLLGLAHVDDAQAIMSPETHLSVIDYSPGDRRGLYAVSQGECAPQL